MQEPDYKIFSDVTDYPHKPGILIKSKLINNFQSFDEVNFKMEVSQELFAQPEFINDIEDIIEKQSELLITMYNYFLELKAQKQHAKKN